MELLKSLKRHKSFIVIELFATSKSELRYVILFPLSCDGS